MHVTAEKLDLEDTLQEPQDDDQLDVESLSRDDTRRAIYAMLFASDRPLSASRISEALYDVDPHIVESLLGELRDKIDRILAHCKYPLHTSLLEGMNNKIKVIKRMAYGYRDQDYFFLKIRAAFPGIPG